MGELVIADLTAPAPGLAADPRVRAVTGDLHGAVGDLGDADVIFHLAGVVSGAAEADFDLGMHTNVDGTRAVLEHARRQAQRQARPPVLVFSSSIAVFGIDPAAGPQPREARPGPGWPASSTTTRCPGRSPAMASRSSSASSSWRTTPARGSSAAVRYG